MHQFGASRDVRPCAVDPVGEVIPLVTAQKKGPSALVTKGPGMVSVGPSLSASEGQGSALRWRSGSEDQPLTAAAARTAANAETRAAAETETTAPTNGTAGGAGAHGAQALEFLDDGAGSGNSGHDQTP